MHRDNQAIAARVGLAVGFLLLTAVTAATQDLEPRAYAPAPIGTSFVLLGFGRSEGGYILDPSLDIDNVEADISFTTTGFGYTFDLAGRQARVLAVLPAARGEMTGEVEGSVQSEDLGGLVDPRFKLSIGLAGAPALPPETFAQAPRRTAVGANLTVMPPWGQYDSGQLVNLGYNRWAFKPEVGISHPAGRFTLEGSAGVWLFTTNHDYYPGRAERRQDPVVAVQGHVAYTFPGRAWLGLNGTWFSGGKTEVDGVANSDRQSNVRLGTTLSLPITRRQSIKFVYSTGSSTRRGSDFDTVNVTWQRVHF